VICPADRIVKSINDLCLQYVVIMLCSTGTGGKEASLFTQEMLVMYQRLVMRTACITVLTFLRKALSSQINLLKVHIFVRLPPSVTSETWA